MSDRVTPPCAGAPADRVPVVDGAMDAVLRSADQPFDDFAGHEGCHRSRNVIGHDVVRQVRRRCLAVGADAAETNTFGADRADQVERGRAEKIFELSRRGAELAREAADEDHGRAVLDSVGPGTEPPARDYPPYASLRSTYFERVNGEPRG
jgi:5-methyltetrahydrofolate--homocysteine methyltransferase